MLGTLLVVLQYNPSINQYVIVNVPRKYLLHCDRNNIQNLIFIIYINVVITPKKIIFRHFELKSDSSSDQMDMEKVRTWIGKIISFIRENKLTAATFLGVLIGIFVILL